MTAHRFWTLTCNGCGEIWDCGTPASLSECKKRARSAGWSTDRIQRDEDLCSRCVGQLPRDGGDLVNPDERYTPSETAVRHAYVVIENRRDILPARAEFDRFLARVRREALDGLIADKAHIKALLRAENGGNVEDVLTHYRDTHYPEENQ